MRYFKRLFMLSLPLFTLVLMLVSSSYAGNYVLTNNSGTSNDMYFISGEPSLIINGFDLQTRGISRPVGLDAVSIDVVTPVQGQVAEVVVYQDADGGDPINATLVGRQTVSITQSGVFTTTFSPALQITQPVLWVGFYLPVGFEFNADNSGTSVLTYWGWTTGSTFDLTSLRNAEVFGPADGSAPVSIDMGGVARITAELVTTEVPTVLPTATTASYAVSGDLYEAGTDSQDRIVQVVGDPATSLAPMRSYGSVYGCGALYYDSADIAVNYRSGVQAGCKTTPRELAPIFPTGYFFPSQTLYDVTFFWMMSAGTNRMNYPITHCILASGSYLNSAVIGLAHGSPREWEILPTIRYGNYVCANLYYSGTVAYFSPN